MYIIGNYNKKKAEWITPSGGQATESTSTYMDY